MSVTLASKIQWDVAPFTLYAQLSLLICELSYLP